MLLPFLIAQVAAQTATTDARVIVKYKADSTLLRKDSPTAAAQSANQTKALAARTGLKLTAGAVVADRAHVVFGSGMSSEELAARLAAESAERYGRVPPAPVERNASPQTPPVAPALPTARNQHRRKRKAPVARAPPATEAN